MTAKTTRSRTTRQPIVTLRCPGCGAAHRHTALGLRVPACGHPYVVRVREQATAA